MDRAIALDRPAVSNRIVACVWCHGPASRADVTRNHGLCRSCVENNAEISWRLVYDRDRQFGSIPPNLRAAYCL